MLYFEDFSEGRRFDYTPVEMKPAEMIAFASEFDQQPMHLDEEAGKRSILGGLAASGWHTSAVGMRMMLDAFMGNSTSQGSPGIDFMDWRKPVIAGDILNGFSLVLEARRSNSKPDLGIVKFRNEITNQAGEPMAVSECTVLFRCREKGQA
ncbi:MaoC family dehydratase [Sinorhizobium sp. NFACC03]|uniref:MaoC family dehydratase n=1 Tax=Sinorhizobium sp. NFACC03 TaxID=1566295 RepID=UPI00087F094B|nr:MaoC family dehydratase [Sinorhizobium sp. NFACC03]SDA84989.1 Acyl dehydratase [Sinorhizobium sp. NFACC03]